MNSLINDLIYEMKKLPVIDSHEHLKNEKDLLCEKADVFTRIFCHYSITNAISSGMTIDRNTLKNTDIPLERRWEYFRPFLRAIKNTGYARPGQIAARDLYGIDEINDTTYIELSEKLQSSNKPGLYSSIFKNECNIEYILNQGDWVDEKGGYSVSVSRDFYDLDRLSFKELYEKYYSWKTLYGSDFENAVDWLRFWCSRLQDTGSVGLKFAASLPVACIDDKEAESIFRKFKKSPISDGEASDLASWLMHKVIESAPEYRFVIAVHCGLIWNGQGNFRDFSPMNIIPLLMKYSNTVFDLYHGGMPWVRETAVIGNQYPNVNLNLVWCHQISPYMTEQMLNEWIDLVPANKIIGFGGDNCDGPEKTYGALQMAFENIARALSVRILRKQITEENAIKICMDWFCENPKRIYNLE